MKKEVNCNFHEVPHYKTLLFLPRQRVVARLWSEGSWGWGLARLAVAVVAAPVPVAWPV